MFKHIAVLRRCSMSIILCILRELCPKRYIAQLKRKLDDWTFGKSRCASSKGMVHLLEGYFVYFGRVLFLQEHTALLQRKITLIDKGMLHFCFEYCICWQLQVCCNYAEDICRNCVLLKGHRSIYPRQSEHLDTSSHTYSLVDNAFSCVQRASTMEKVHSHSVLLSF